MISLSQAQQQLLDKHPPHTAGERLGVETLSLLDALGRVAASDVHSSMALPPSDNSAMDGFALHSDALQHGITQLPVSQRIAAGSAPQPLEPATAARIFTGANLPSGANAVVIQEHCDYQEGGATVQINTTVKPMDNVRAQGQDIQAGALVVRQGQRLNAIDLSLLASIGHASVAVYKTLRVAIFSTGDELIEPGQALQAGQIYNSNRTLLLALCQQLGYQTIDCGIVADTLEATQAALEQAAQTADVIISSGGVSVGEEDHVRPAIEAIGQLDMWKVQMKPGKPVAYGRIGQTPLLGLPGNPVSSFVVFQLLGVVLLRVLSGDTSELPRSYNVLAGFDKKLSDREDYIRVRLERDSQARLVAQPFANLSSGVMSSLAWADGLLRQPIDTAINAGQGVEFLPLCEGML